MKKGRGRGGEEEDEERDQLQCIKYLLLGLYKKINICQPLVSKI